jgi:ATP-dependent Lon protease
MYVCKYLYKRGKLKNTQCGAQVTKDGDFCSLHSKKQKKQIPALHTINTQLSDYLEYKKNILNLDTIDANKLVLIRHLQNMKILDSSSTEYYKNKIFLDNALRIPFKLFKKFTINKDEHYNIIGDFLLQVKEEFNKHIYGMEDVKNEMLNYVAKKISNPNSQRHNLALVGPPGIGKTTFVKVLSDVLGIPMKTIPLGGMRDASYLTGHGYVYVESSPGKIIQTFVDAKCMNPIIYFDELDKVSQTEQGKEIFSLLMNLTDPSLNNNFQDNYFHGMSFDVSQALFVFTFNDIHSVDRILLDRLNVIHLSEPSVSDKKEILKTFCLPDILHNTGIDFPVEITNDALDYLISQMKLIQKNTQMNVLGIRNLYRVLEKIIQEVNKNRFIDKIEYIKLELDEHLIKNHYSKLKTQFNFDNDDSDNTMLYHLYS